MIELNGERVVIRSTTENNLTDIMHLWNNGEVMKWVGFPDGLGYSLQDMRKWYERLLSTPERHHFLVQAEQVGFCGEVFYAVDGEYNRAGLDIKFMPGAQGRGLATDALKTLIRHVFEQEPEVNAVWVEPSEVNTAARDLYTRCSLTPKPRPADMDDYESYWELNRADFIRLY